jgi:hypothetical protein
MSDLNAANTSSASKPPDLPVEPSTFLTCCMRPIADKCDLVATSSSRHRRRTRARDDDEVLTVVTSVARQARSPVVKADCLQDPACVLAPVRTARLYVFTSTSIVNHSPLWLHWVKGGLDQDREWHVVQSEMELSLSVGSINSPTARIWHAPCNTGVVEHNGPDPPAHNTHRSALPICFSPIAGDFGRRLHLFLFKAAAPLPKQVVRSACRCCRDSPLNSG